MSLRTWALLVWFSFGACRQLHLLSPLALTAALLCRILRFVDEYLQGCQAFLSVESSLTVSNHPATIAHFICLAPAPTTAAASTTTPPPPLPLSQKYQLAGCRKFEYGAGALLADLWQHTEAVVSSDLQMGAASLKAICELVQSRPPIHKLLAEAPSPSREEIPEVAPAVRDGGAAASGGSGAPSEPSPAVVASRYIEAAERLPPLGLEAFVLRMLLGYSKAAVGPAERRIVGEFMHRGVLEAGFVHLQVFGELLPEEEVAAGAEGLAKLIATEEFGSNKVSCGSREEEGFKKRADNNAR